ncbi:MULTISPECIES: DUF3017 domain-containing protein [unclassified Rhodococcus (in: high G+C Gram-positive bacteria)]|uniref:DUF3017 domain-containing protein n=1 Tax=unclassified Rhodococcus (in: high G+C Gram-positive bacteria) TaxID=192944 RepID=UPI0018CCA2F2|nr:MULTISPECIES: DUF3017 domain-containing protein [unclassified Rhodococcus (in: high G+C Gram-positive bacteria)]MBH0122332.1 DUF3017 domain-containing protein [Rhodococcus sp. CX]MCK8669937.1 DUF3017 domain-containing protein [Rhodococcus sp. HM1]
MDRWMRFARRNLPLVAVTVVIAAAVVLVLADRWRRGAFVFGGAVILAGVLRWALAPEQVGVLAVRGKRFDVAAMLLVGGAIVALAVSIDPLGTG